MASSIFNPELFSIARDRVQKSAGRSQVLFPNKQAFVDPAMAAGGMPPGGGDPAAAAMAGPMPPMPGMPPEGDPAASAMGGGGMEERLAKIEAAIANGGAGGAGGEGMKKPKVDVNTEIYHIKKMLAKLLGTLGVQMDATDMLGDPAEDPEVPPEEAAQDPHSAASQQSSISTIGPIQGASPALAAAGGGASPGAPPQKSAGWQGFTNKASALASVLRRANGN